MGDADAKFMYAINQLKHTKKDEWLKGYEQLLKLLEEGYADAFYLDHNYDLKNTLGFSKKNIKEYEEFKKSIISKSNREPFKSPKTA